jgi:hypothetical protein
MFVVKFVLKLVSILFITEIRSIVNHRRDLGGGTWVCLAPPFSIIAAPKCIHVNLHLNIHYSLCIEKQSFYRINLLFK